MSVTSSASSQVWDAPVPADPDVGPEDHLGGGRAEEHERLRRDDLELGLQPRPARRDVHPLRGLMNLPATALCEAEVLDDVADIRITALDSGALRCLVEDSAGRPDERMTLAVLSITRLLADEHQPRPGAALAHDRLGRLRMQLAGVAALDRLTKGCEGGPLGYRSGRLSSNRLTGAGAPGP